MALLRASIRNRLGSRSIYDCIIENLSDFETEPMLDQIHTGSTVLCLNLDAQRGSEQDPPICYIKSSEAEWVPLIAST